MLTTAYTLKTFVVSLQILKMSKSCKKQKQWSNVSLHYFRSKRVSIYRLLRMFARGSMLQLQYAFMSGSYLLCMDQNSDLGIKKLSVCRIQISVVCNA